MFSRGFLYLSVLAVYLTACLASRLELDPAEDSASPETAFEVAEYGLDDRDVRADSADLSYIDVSPEERDAAEESDDSMAMKRRDQRPLPRPRPTGAAGLFADLLSSLTRPTESSGCPGRCYHAITALMCAEILEDRPCPRPSMRCCVETNPTRPGPRPNRKPAIRRRRPPSRRPATDRTTINPPQSSTTVIKEKISSSTPRTTTRAAVPDATAVSTPSQGGNSEQVELPPVQKKRISCPGVCVASRIAHYCEAALDSPKMCADDQRCCVPRNLFDSIPTPPPGFVLLKKDPADETKSTQTTQADTKPSTKFTESTTEMPMKLKLPPKPSSLPEMRPEPEEHQLEQLEVTEAEDTQKHSSRPVSQLRPVVNQGAAASTHKEVVVNSNLRPQRVENKRKNVRGTLNQKTTSPGENGAHFDSSVNPLEGAECRGQCVSGLFSYLCGRVDVTAECSNGGRCCLARNAPQRRPGIKRKTTTERMEVTTRGTEPSTERSESDVSTMEAIRSSTERSVPSQENSQSTRWTPGVKDDMQIKYQNGGSLQQDEYTESAPGAAEDQYSSQSQYSQFSSDSPPGFSNEEDTNLDRPLMMENYGYRPDETNQNMSVERLGEPLPTDKHNQLQRPSSGHQSHQKYSYQDPDLSEESNGSFADQATDATSTASQQETLHQNSIGTSSEETPTEGQCPGTCLPNNMASLCRPPARPLPEVSGCPPEQLCCGGPPSQLSKRPAIDSAPPLPPSTQSGGGGVLNTLFGQTLSGGGGTSAAGSLLAQLAQGAASAGGGAGGILGSLAPLAASLLGGGGGAGSVLPSFLGGGLTGGGSGGGSRPSRLPPLRPDRYDSVQGRPSQSPTLAPPTTPPLPADTRPLCPDTCISPLLSFTCFGRAEVTDVFRCAVTTEQRCCAKKSSVRAYWESLRRPSVTGYQRYPPLYPEYQPEQQRYPGSESSTQPQDRYPSEYQQYGEGYEYQGAQYEGYPQSSEYPNQASTSTSDGQSVANTRVPSDNVDQYRPEDETSNDDTYYDQQDGAYLSSDDPPFGDGFTNPIDSPTTYQQSEQTSDEIFRPPLTSGGNKYRPNLPPSADVKYRQPDETAQIDEAVPTFAPALTNTSAPRRNKYVCGVKGPGPTREARVVGGRDAEPGEWCWHVALVNSLNQYLCGGALIGTQWVLTAAHCITNIVRSGDAIYVRVGDHDLTSKQGSPGAQTLRVSTTYIHHNHNTQTLDNDIALLRLHGKVELTEGVCLVCLPVRGVEQEPGSRCTVSGYGYMGEEGNIPLRVRAAELPIVSNSDCVNKINSVTEKVFVLPSSSFCAGGELGHDACQGDGGGPLVCPVDGYYELSGIVSWGFGCGRKDVPGVYVKIASFIGWINQIISVNSVR